MPGIVQRGSGNAELPTISVVVLNYNGRGHLEACLSSVESQAYPKELVEIIVVDNASTDDSLSWLRRTRPSVRLLENGRNLGFAAGINRGAAAGRGSHLAFLNADMRAHPNWLLALARTISAAPDVACAGSIVLNWEGDKVDFAGRPNDALNLCPSPPGDARAIWESGRDVSLLFASGGAMLVKRDTFLDLGGFDEEFFLYNEDVDLGWRLWLQGHRVLRSTDSVVYHKGGASAKQFAPETVMGMAQEYALETLLKNMDDEQLWTMLPGVLWFLVDRSRWYHAAGRSLGQAFEGLAGRLPAVWQKRMGLQAQRTRSDRDIFAACGHPFGFLLDNAEHSRFRRYLENCDVPTRPPMDAADLGNLLTQLLLHAYKFSFERLVDNPAPAAASVESTTRREGLVGRGAARLEDAARRVLPPRWRYRLGPLWHRIRP